MLNINIRVLKDLISLSNSLDSKGLFSIADQVDNIIKTSMPLSQTELDQLGTKKPGSSFDYIGGEDWESLRGKLVSKKPSKSYIETDEFKYDPELTAYTPGEALELLDNPKIQDWFDKIEEFRIPEEYKHIILVPCAASKPWGVNCPSSGKYYKAYHAIKEKLSEEDKKAYWVTISEPLGIVPQDMWDSFPGYDVPGLFKDPSSRMSGMTTKQWKEMFGQKYSPPFDEKAYDEAIRRLGEVVARFIKNNTTPDRRWISFVKGTKGKLTTHTEMINEANKALAQWGVKWKHNEFTKDEDSPGHPTKSRVEKHISKILEKEINSTQFKGYKIVGYDDGRLFSLQNPSLEYSSEIGREEHNLNGIYLGTTEGFVKDYYSGLTDSDEALLVFDYNKDDIIKGDPEEDGEVKVYKATLTDIRVL